MRDAWRKRKGGKEEEGRYKEENRESTLKGNEKGKRG